VNAGGNHSGSPPPGPKPYFGPFELPGLKAGPGEFLTSKLTEAAQGFIREQKQNPFFLYLAHYSPHIPLSARAEDVARHEAKAAGRYDPVYAAMVESVDESVGGVLRALRENGLADNTVVMFTSDNGGLRYEGKSKRLVTDNAPLRAGKGHLYEGGIREPLLVRGPGFVRPRPDDDTPMADIDTPVCHIDFLPTLLSLAGRRAAGVDGIDFAPLLRGRKTRPRPLYWHYPHWSNQGGEPGSAIREGDWKLIEFFVDGRRELYNLREDPGEKVNLLRREPRRARELYSRLDAWRRRNGAVIPQRNPQVDPNWPGLGLTGEERPTVPAGGY
jgi:arylsulfatase A-like enzyme